MGGASSTPAPSTVPPANPPRLPLPQIDQEFRQAVKLGNTKLVHYMLQQQDPTHHQRAEQDQPAVAAGSANDINERFGMDWHEADCTLPVCEPRNAPPVIADTSVFQVANLHSTDGDGWQPIHLAAARGHSSMVQTLLQVQASVDMQHLVAPDKRNLLHIAVSAGDVPTVKLILNELQRQQDSFSTIDIESDAPCSTATATKTRQTIEQTLEMRTSVSLEGVLHLAVLSMNAELVTLLIKQRADVNARSKSQETPLHYAARYQLLDCMRVLLDNKASVDATNDADRTALHLCNSYSAAEILLGYGANVNAVDQRGGTALHYSAPISSSLELSSLLVQYGAELTAVNVCIESVLREVDRMY
jgi:ankyrin repeat protein